MTSFLISFFIRRISFNLLVLYTDKTTVLKNTAD